MPRRLTIQQKLSTPLSKDELCSFLGCREEDIIPYSTLRNYDTIEQLLPDDKTFKILLLEEEPRRGHWVAIYRKSSMICYANSYGEKPDRDMNCIPRLVRKMLGEDRPEISRLCGEREIWYNDVKLQGKTSQVCGRYCVYFIEMNKMGYSPDEALDKLMKLKHSKQYDSYDEAICALTP
jgi:hypothetical protein